MKNSKQPIYPYPVDMAYTKTHLLNLVIPLDRLISVNQHLVPAYGRRGLCLAPKVRDYKEQIKKYIQSHYKGQSITIPIDYQYYTVRFNFYLNYRFQTRDTSNLVKNSEDAIVDAINSAQLLHSHTNGPVTINDAQFIQVDAYKLFTDNKQEVIEFSLQGVTIVQDSSN